MEDNSIISLHIRNVILFYLISVILNIFPGVSPMIVTAIILGLLQLTIYLIYTIFTKGKKTKIYVPIVMAFSFGGHGLFYIIVQMLGLLIRLSNIKSDESITIPVFTSTFIICLVFSVLVIRILDRYFIKSMFK